MVKAKRILTALLCLIVAVSVMVSGMLIVSADDSIYGTPEKGIEGKSWSFVSMAPTEKLMNGDFEQGLKYWAATPSNNRDAIPTMVAEIKEESGNKYMTFKGQYEWDGLVSPRFKCEGMKVNQQLVLLYDWRGVSDFQLYLAQWLMTPNGEGYYKKDANGNNEIQAENRLSIGSSTILKEATTDTEWNTTMTHPAKPVVEIPEDADQTFYLSIGIQVMTDPSIEADIDNVRVAIYRDSEKKIYDMDGTTVLYDLKALEEEEVEEEEETEEEEFEEEEEEFEEDTNTNADSDTDSDADADADETEDDSKSANTAVIWIYIGAGVVVVAAAVVVVLLILKKKKTAVLEQPEETSPSEE